MPQNPTNFSNAGLITLRQRREAEMLLNRLKTLVIILSRAKLDKAQNLRFTVEAVITAYKLGRLPTDDDQMAAWFDWAGPLQESIGTNSMQWQTTSLD